MEYILEDTNIFDKDIYTKFNDMVKDNREDFINGKSYQLIVRFHTDLLNDPKIQEFDVPVSKCVDKYSEKDKMYDVMSYQLNRLEQILKENDIEVYSNSIEGDYLESRNLIKIEINEDTSEPYYVGRGKNRKRMAINSIVPNKTSIIDKASKLAGERLSELFNNLMDVIKDKSIMAEILEIETTEKEEKLFEVFVENYGELWLTTSEREKEVIDKLQKRCIEVIRNRINEKME